MSYLATAPVVTVTVTGLPPGTESALLRFSAVLGAQPAACEIDLPNLALADHSTLHGQTVDIFRDDAHRFRGEVVEVDDRAARGLTGVHITAVDYRHAMNAQVIGQYGIGPVTSWGGWPGVGYDVVFNPKNRPNMSAGVDGDGVASWDLTDLAEPWTYDAIMRFLFKWYVPSTVCTLDNSLLLGPWLDPAPELDLRGLRIADAVDHICRAMGGLWTLRYNGTSTGAATDLVPTFLPIHANVPAAAARTLFLDNGTGTEPPTAWAVTPLALRTRSLNCIDRLEIHTDKSICETTYDSTSANPLLVIQTGGEELPPDCIAYFDVDVTKYSANSLGQNLDTGSPPKKWLSALVTQLVDGVGYNPSFDPAFRGPDMSAIETVRLSTDSGATWKRVKSGVRLDMERMRLYVKRNISFYGATAAAPGISRKLSTTTGLAVAVTIATLNEFPMVSETAATSLFLSRTRCRKVNRRDFIPLYRVASKLPDVAVDNPNTFTDVATTLAAYYDPTAELTVLRTALFAGRNELEVAFAGELPLFPDMAVGDSLTTSPLVLWPTLTNPVRVTRMEYDVANLGVRFAATNNLDGGA